MKNLISICLAVLMSLTLSTEAQDMKKRKSPLKTTTGTVAGSDITISYSSPSVKDRTIWGDLVSYDKVWRTGANEATTFETSKDIMVEGKKLAAGKYALFTIPTEKEWTIIFNTESKQWGAYKYDESKDALRVNVKPMKAEHEEMMMIKLDDDKMVIAWEKLMVPVKLSK